MKKIILALVLTSPMVFAQETPNARRQSMEIRNENGNVFINGKPLAEATPEERAIYDRMESGRNDGNVRVRVQGRPLESRENRTITIQRCQEGTDCPPLPPLPPVPPLAPLSPLSEEDVERRIERRIEMRCQGGEDCQVIEEEKPRVIEMRIECDDSTEDCPMPEIGGNRVMIWKAGDGQSLNIDSVQVHTFEREMRRGRDNHSPREFVFRSHGEAMPHGNAPQVMMFNSEDGEMPEMMGNVLGGMRAGRNAFKFEMPNREVMEMEREVRQLAHRIKRAEGNEKADLKRELQSKLETLFAKKEEARQERIERLENQLREEREKGNERKRNKNDIIERRMNQLLGENDALDWR